MKLTQEQRIKLHSATGISLSTIQRWLKGGPNNLSTSETLRKACNELGFRPTDETSKGYVIELGSGVYVKHVTNKRMVRTFELSKARVYVDFAEASCMLKATGRPYAHVIEVDLPSEGGSS